MATRIDHRGKWLTMTISQRPARATITYSDKRKPAKIIKWSRPLDYGLFLAEEVLQYLGVTVTFFDYTTVALRVDVGPYAVISPMDVRMDAMEERYGEAIQRGIDYILAPAFQLKKVG